MDIGTTFDWKIKGDQSRYLCSLWLFDYFVTTHPPWSNEQSAKFGLFWMTALEDFGGAVFEFMRPCKRTKGRLLLIYKSGKGDCLWRSRTSIGGDGFSSVSYFKLIEGLTRFDYDRRTAFRVWLHSGLRDESCLSMFILTQQVCWDRMAHNPPLMVDPFWRLIYGPDWIVVEEEKRGRPRVCLVICAGEDLI